MFFSKWLIFPTRACWLLLLSAIHSWFFFPVKPHHHNDSEQEQQVLSHNTYCWIITRSKKTGLIRSWYKKLDPQLLQSEGSREQQSICQRTELLLTVAQWLRISKFGWYIKKVIYLAKDSVQCWLIHVRCCGECNLPELSSHTVNLI